MFWRPSDTPEDVLIHYAKGTTAKKHKYIRKEGKKYIYKETGAYKKYADTHYNEKTRAENLKKDTKANNKVQQYLEGLDQDYIDKNITMYDNIGAVTLDPSSAVKVVDAGTGKTTTSEDFDKLSKGVDEAGKFAQNPGVYLIKKGIEAGTSVAKASKAKSSEKNPKHLGTGGKFNPSEGDKKQKVSQAKKANANAVAQTEKSKAAKRKASKKKADSANAATQKEKKNAVKSKIEAKNKKSSAIIAEKQKEKDKRAYKAYRKLLSNYRKNMADYKSRPTR